MFLIFTLVIIFIIIFDEGSMKILNFHNHDHLVDIVVILVVGAKRHDGPQAKTV